MRLRKEYRFNNGKTLRAFWVQKHTLRFATGISILTIVPDLRILVSLNCKFPLKKLCMIIHIWVDVSFQFKRKAVSSLSVPILQHFIFFGFISTSIYVAVTSVSPLFTKRDSTDNTHNIVKVTENVSYILRQVHCLKHLLQLLTWKKKYSWSFQRLLILWIYWKEI